MERRPAALFGVLLSVGMSYLLYPYTFGLLHNHGIQIPILRKLQDPTLFPGDPFMDTYRGYGSLFWPLAAWAAQRLPIEPLFLCVHIATLTATYAGVFRLTQLLCPTERRAPFVALWCYLWWTPYLGGESLHWPYLAHTPVAMALGIWSLIAVLQERIVLAAFLSAVVFNVHALQGVYLLPMQAAALYRATRPIVPRVLAATLVYGVVAAPTVDLLLRYSSAIAPPDLPELLRAFFPQHFFVTAFSAGDWWAVGWLLGAYIAAVFIGPWSVEGLRAQLMAGALLAFMAAGGVLDEFLPTSVILKLHALRASAYFVVLVLCMAAVTGTRVARHLPREIGLIALAMVTFLILDRTFAQIAVRWLGAGPPIVVGLVLVVVWWRFLRARPAVTNALAACALLVIVAARIWYDWSLPDHYYAPGHHLHRNGDWVQVQRWARQETDRSDKFLIPPPYEGFRVFSERPVVGEWKDGAAVMWQPGYADYWRDWYHAYGGTFDPSDSRPIWTRLYSSWMARPPDEVLTIARHFGAKYIVLDKDYLGEHPWPGPPVYSGGRFSVFRAE